MGVDRIVLTCQNKPRFRQNNVESDANNNLKNNLKKLLTNHKPCGKITKLLQMSEKLKQFKQFNGCKFVKIFLKNMKKVLDNELWMC